uniref:arginine--tRNA ligase n=1 Tax=Bionectria ochroleuca TaxID=29856 RepID=A0A0B7JSA2_BIOOC
MSLPSAVSIRPLHHATNDTVRETHRQVDQGVQESPFISFTDMETLTSTLLALEGNVDRPAPNPFDVYRIHVSQIISAITGASPEVVFPALQVARSLSEGDLILATAALQLADADPSQLIRNKFPESVLVNHPVADHNNSLQFYFKPAPLAALVLPQALDNTTCHIPRPKHQTPLDRQQAAFLQSSFDQLNSLLSTADIGVEQLLTADFSLLTEKSAVDIVRTLAHWPVVLGGTSSVKQPADVSKYLLELARLLEASYSQLDIGNGEQAVKIARLALYVSAQRVLTSGMQLLNSSY